VGLLAVVWLPFASRIPVEIELAPVAVTVPAPSAEIPSLFSPGPFVTPVIYEGVWVGGAVPTIWERRSGSEDLFEPLLQTGSSVSESDPSR
jgi:hypothetical protein